MNELSVATYIKVAVSDRTTKSIMYPSEGLLVTVAATVPNSCAGKVSIIAAGLAIPYVTFCSSILTVSMVMWIDHHPSQCVCQRTDRRALIGI